MAEPGCVKCKAQKESRGDAEDFEIGTRTVLNDEANHLRVSAPPRAFFLRSSKNIFAKNRLVATRSETAFVHVARIAPISAFDIQEIFTPCRRPKKIEKLPLKNAGGFPIFITSPKL
jgi:hypothetical protein